MEEKKRRAINFDLNDALLREHFSESNPKGAYRKLAAFFEENGFEHRQYSGYCSVKAISNLDVCDIIFKLKMTFPWLEKCVMQFDITNIGKIYDGMKIFEMCQNYKDGCIQDYSQAIEEALENAEVNEFNMELDIEI